MVFLAGIRKPSSNRLGAWTAAAAGQTHPGFTCGGAGNAGGFSGRKTVPLCLGMLFLLKRWWSEDVQCFRSDGEDCWLIEEVTSCFFMELEETTDYSHIDCTLWSAFMNLF